MVDLKTLFSLTMSGFGVLFWGKKPQTFMIPIYSSTMISMLVIDDELV